MDEESFTSRFEVREVFRLRSRQQIVIAGVILEGLVRIGDIALFELHEGLHCSAEIIAVEYLDRRAVSDSLVCLALTESDPAQAALYASLCPLGSVLKIEPRTASMASRQGRSCR